MREDLRNILRKYGVFGLLACVIYTILSFVFNSIFELEVQNFWSNSVKDWFFSGHNLIVQNWQIFAAVTGVIVAIAVYYFRRSHIQRKVPMVLNTRSLKLPQKDHPQGKRNVEVIRALREVRLDRISKEQFAQIVEDALNSDSIDDAAAVDILGDYGYRLYKNHNNTWSVEPINKKKGEE